MTWTQNLGRVKGDRGSALVPTIVQTATDIAISWSPSDDKYDGPVPETIHFEPIYYIPYIDEDPQTGDVVLKWTHNKANDPTAPNIILPNDVSIKGEKIPKLEDALVLAKKLNCNIVVDTMIESNMQEIYDLVLKTGMLNNVIFSEFETSSYSKLLTINSSLPFICSMNTADYNKVDAFVQLAGDKVNKCGMSVYSKVITKDLADYIHSKGLNLYLYVLDTPSAVLDSLQYNPDGIFTNVCHTSRIIAENTI